MSLVATNTIRLESISLYAQSIKMYSHWKTERREYRIKKFLNLEFKFRMDARILFHHSVISAVSKWCANKLVGFISVFNYL